MNVCNDFVFDLPVSRDERVIDLSVSGDECVIDPPTCNDDVDVASNGEYHNQMSPAAREVSQMFPAAMVSDLFPINKEMVVINESVTSSMTTESLMSSTTSESMTSSMTSDSNTTVEWIYYDDYVEVEDLTTKLIKFINIAAPGAVYSMSKSRRRRRKRKMKAVHPELRILFQHCEELFSPSPAAPVPVSRPPVPLVDWSRVNSRSLGNLPQPKMFPKLGCSNDPVFYEPVIDNNPIVRITHPAPHKKPFPFGGEFGLMTDVGVISTNKGDQMEDPYNHIIHGHVWSRDQCCWVIHARFPRDKVNNNPKSAKEGGRISRKPKKKLVESR